MSDDMVAALLIINERQADVADADLLALMLEDVSSLRVAQHDQTRVETYVDAAGAKHQVQTVVRP